MNYLTIRAQDWREQLAEQLPDKFTATMTMLRDLEYLSAREASLLIHDRILQMQRSLTSVLSDSTIKISCAGESPIVERHDVFVDLPPRLRFRFKLLGVLTGRSGCLESVCRYVEPVDIERSSLRVQLEVEIDATGTLVHSVGLVRLSAGTL